jgi:hypothetical protein
MRFLLYARLLSFSLASPVLVTKIPFDDAALSKRASWNAEALNNEFKGIWWDHVFEEGNCTPEQIDKLVYATRATMRFTRRPIDDQMFQNSAAWDRYFGRYSEYQFYGSHYLQVSADIMCQYDPSDLLYSC